MCLISKAETMPGRTRSTKAFRDTEQRRKATRGRVRTPKASRKEMRPLEDLARSALECDASSHRFLFVRQLQWHVHRGRRVANYFSAAANWSALGTACHCTSNSPVRPNTNT